MMHRKLALAVIGATLASIAVAGNASAETDRVTEGRTHFSRGVEYYKDEDYRNAMVEFKRAYELAPNYKLLYNLGQTAQDLKDYAFALKSLEHYLEEGGADISAERRAEVSTNIRKLKQRVAEVTLKSNASDAEVLVDDVPTGRTPLSAALIISAGRRTITISKGGLTATRTLEVAGGDRAELSIDLDSAQPSSAAGPRAEEPRLARTTRVDSRKANSEGVTNAAVTSHKQRGSSATWLGVTATGVFAVAAGVTGYFALAARRDFDATLDRYPIAPEDVSDARTKTKNFALATDILAGAAILSCGVTVWMALSNSSSDTRTANHVGLTVTPTGLAARGTF